MRCRRSCRRTIAAGGPTTNRRDGRLASRRAAAEVATDTPALAPGDRKQSLPPSQLWTRGSGHREVPQAYLTTPAPSNLESAVPESGHSSVAAWSREYARSIRILPQRADRSLCGPSHRGASIPTPFLVPTAHAMKAADSYSWVGVLPLLWQGTQQNLLAKQSGPGAAVFAPPRPSGDNPASRRRGGASPVGVVAPLREP